MRVSTQQLGNFKGRNGQTPDSLHNPLIRHHRIIVSRHSIAAKYHQPQSNVSEPWPIMIKVPVKYHPRHFLNWATSSDWQISLTSCQHRSRQQTGHSPGLGHWMTPKIAGSRVTWPLSLPKTRLTEWIIKDKIDWANGRVLALTKNLSLQRKTSRYPIKDGDLLKTCIKLN